MLRSPVDPSTLDVQNLLRQVSTKENFQHELIEIGKEVADVSPRSSRLPWAARWTARQALQAVAVKFETPPRIDETESRPLEQPR
jgi:hypothetical protein